MIKHSALKCLVALLLSLISTPTLALTIYGHRGARGLSPENSMPAYKTALALGVNYVDMDINMTKDGVLVITHNFSLNPDITTLHGHYIKSDNIFIKDLTFKQLEQYDVGKIDPNSYYATLFPYQKSVPGTRIPSLKSVIDYVKKHAGNKVGFQIEIKTTPVHPDWTFPPKKLAVALARLIKQEHIVDRTQVQAYDWRCLLDVKKIDPKIKTAFITDHQIGAAMRSPDAKIAGEWSAGYLLKNYHNSIPLMVKKLGGDYWDPEDIELTADQLKQAHRLGLKVIAWHWRQTVPHANQRQMIRLIKIGVDGIITDRPDILRGLLAGRGYTLPPIETARTQR